MLTELVDVRPYDWTSLPACGFFEVLGKRGTGKTTWAQFILQSSPTRSSGIFIVMAGSETAKRSWSEIVHPIFVVDASTRYLETLRDTQNEKVRQHRKQGTEFPDAMRVTLVLDDVSFHKKLMRSQILAYLASNSRHLQMSVFILAQYHCQIVTEVRNQFDMVFMLNTSDKKSIDRVHAEFCSSVDLRIFRHVLAFTTRDFGLLVIDNQATSGDISDTCFHGKMPSYPPPLERLGAPDAWQYGDGHYCDDEQRPSEENAEEWQRDRAHNQNHVVQDRKGRIIIRMV